MIVKPERGGIKLLDRTFTQPIRPAPHAGQSGKLPGMNGFSLLCRDRADFPDVGQSGGQLPVDEFPHKRGLPCAQFLRQGIFLASRREAIGDTESSPPDRHSEQPIEILAQRLPAF